MFPFVVLLALISSATSQNNPAHTRPPQVQGVTITRTAQVSCSALRVSWSAVSGSGITYTVCYSAYPDAGTASDPPDNANCNMRGITSTSTTLGRLSLGTLYFIWVAAVSSGGRGPYSSRQGRGTYQVPSQVTGLSVTQTAVAGRPALRVSWSKLQSDATITRYEVQYKVNISGSWATIRVTDAYTLTTTLTTLPAGKWYDVRVRAVSVCGIGAYSSVQSQLLSRVPSQVTRLSVTQTAVSGRPALRVSWRRPQSDLPITRYEVQYRVSPSGSWATMRVTGANTLTTLTTLTAGRRYDVRVRAVSLCGNGAYSSVRTQYLNRVPSQVSRPTVTQIIASGRPALRVSWSRSQSDATIIRYEVQHRPSDTTAWSTVTVRGTTTTTTLTTLVAGRSYDVRVRAVSAFGSGAYSSVQTQKLDRDCCSGCSSVRSTTFATFKSSSKVVSEETALVHIDVYRYGPMERPLTLRVIDEPGTASKVQDYSLQSRDLYFINTQEVVEKSTVVVKINNDDTVESGRPETFNLTLYSPDPDSSVVFSVHETTVFIVDNDYE